MMNLTLRGKKSVMICLLAITVVFMFYNSSSKTVTTNNLYYVKREGKVIERVRTNNEWIVNGQILQYSVYGIIYTKTLKLESLVYFPYFENKIVTKRQALLKCVVSDGSNVLVILPVLNVLQINGHLHKLVCELPLGENNMTSSIFIVAVVYEDDYDMKGTQSPIEFKQLPVRSLHYQQVRLFNGEKPKKQAISHCVHMLYGINGLESIEMLKLTNWIDIQRTLGFEQIRFYVLSLHSSITDYLKEKYSSFVTFIQHPTDYHTLCGWHLEMIEKHPQSSLYKQLLHNCNLTFSKVFVELDIGSHDRTCMNDCYLNFKYEYELFANYDIDELILHRHYEMDDLRPLDVNAGVAGYKPKYSIYDYGIRLLNKFGRGEIACLMFKNVALVPNGLPLDKFIRDLQHSWPPQRTGLFFPRHSKVVYSQNNRSLTFTVDHDDSEHVSDIQKFFKMAQKLNKHLQMAEEFQRLVGIYVSAHWGKSIIDTNLTETINHHSCDKWPHTRGIKYDLDLKHGYSSHFRTSINGFLNGKRSSIANVFTDIEYFLLLCTLFSNQTNAA